MSMYLAVACGVAAVFAAAWFLWTLWCIFQAPPVERPTGRDYRLD